LVVFFISSSLGLLSLIIIRKVTFFCPPPKGFSGLFPLEGPVRNLGLYRASTMNPSMSVELHLKLIKRP